MLKACEIGIIASEQEVFETCPERSGRIEWSPGMAEGLGGEKEATCGADGKGESIQALDMVDVFSGWRETTAVKNKAQAWALRGAARNPPRTALPRAGTRLR